MHRPLRHPARIALATYRLPSFLVGALLLAPVLLAADPPAAPPQGAALLKTDILGVFAHPDDETMMAATMARYAATPGKVVAHVYCTRGEGGGNMVGTQSGPALGLLRESELRDCLDILGVRHCFFLDQLDFAYTESLSATLRKWNRDETLERLVRIVRALRPEIIVTINPTPTPGQHGHHMAAGLLATEAFLAAANPNRYPDQLSREGLGAWQPRKLYWNGAAVAPTATATVSVTGPLADGRTPADIAGRALSHHRSQAFGNFAGSPWLRRPQTFTLIHTTVPPMEAESDLLRGLPISESIPTPPLLPPPAAVPGPGLQLAFKPRPAVASFRDWCQRMGLPHVLGSPAADLPVVAGETHTLQLHLTNSGAPLANPSFALEVPEGWKAELSAPPRTISPGRAELVTIHVAVPEHATNDVDLKVDCATASAIARLHPLPRARIPRLQAPPRIDGSDTGWNPAATLTIPATRVVQGQVQGSSDSSAVVRVGHDRHALFVKIDVTDNVLVNNIATNDIKGHWRSDSVEICLDPNGGAEDTLDCFKLGIFPFDQSGRVRAARDADARHGPAEETAPGTRITSARAPDGYRIEVAIPFAEIGPHVGPGRRLGFNVIVYDGDKSEAATGENINKSRIAWAPRPGVQGRPEDWGRIDLE